MMVYEQNSLPGTGYSSTLGFTEGSVTLTPFASKYFDVDTGTKLGASDNAATVASADTAAKPGTTGSGKVDGMDPFGVTTKIDYLNVDSIWEDNDPASSKTKNPTADTAVSDGKNESKKEEAENGAKTGPYHDQIVELKQNKPVTMETGDMMVSTNVGELMTMANGDSLLVHPDGTYQLDSKTGTVQTTDSNGEKINTLHYPNGDFIAFGTDFFGRGVIKFAERQGAIFAFDRNP